MRFRRSTAVVASLLLAAPLTTAATSWASGGRTARSAAPAGVAPKSDKKPDAGGDYNGGKPLPVKTSGVSRRAVATAVADPKVGQGHAWPVLDDEEGTVYIKDFTLRAIGTKSEVWVANDLAFQPGDCRNDERIVITDAQAKYMAGQFDNNIRPKEAQAFSTAPPRSGEDALAPDYTNGFIGPDYYQTNHPDRTVVLVDNVKDDNWYSLNNADHLTYIAGFFYSFFSDFTDRNLMTIDAYDWVHRTTANPPNQPVPGDVCKSKPAQPFDYEGTFAHEYQHLLENAESPGEASWIDEGLADWAQTLTGYVDPYPGVKNSSFDSHIQCFLGWLGTQTASNPTPRRGGPENSLTQWGDQTEDEILCDYGAAYTFMEYLHGQYGTAFMSALHREDLNGMEGLQAVLDQRAPGTTVADVIHRWAAMVAIDRSLDLNGGKLNKAAGAPPTAAYQTKTLNGYVNWSETHSYDGPGAPPNGSDYVRLRDGNGKFLRLDQIDTIAFDGSEELPAKPLEWVVDPDARSGDPALYSEAGDNFDRAAITTVSVPATGDATLSFDAQWDTEEGYDYGFVQVSTDGGETWTSLATEDTTDESDPAALPSVIDNLPGFNGDSGGFQTETADLSDYAGQDVLLSFRYITDSNTGGDGFWVDNVKIGATVISDGSSTTGFQSATEINPIDVPGWTVQLIAYSSTDRSLSVRLRPMRLQAGSARTWDTAFVDQELGTNSKYDLVGAIVTMDDPTEQLFDEAPYTLRVNGTLQPGGSRPE